MTYEDVITISQQMKKRFPHLSCNLDSTPDKSSGYLDVISTEGFIVAGVQWDSQNEGLNGVNSEKDLTQSLPFDRFAGTPINTVDGVMDCLVGLLVPKDVLAETGEYQPNPGERLYANPGEQFFDRGQ